MTPKYLIAKYIPDLRRGEPRNIGIVLWNGERTVAHFLAEIPNQPGVVDGRSLPGFITSTTAYKQWVAFWQSEIAKTETFPLNSNLKVASGSPSFLDALMSFNKGNFVLAEGGILLDRLDSDKLDEALTHLYQNLVEQTTEEARDPTLDEVCEQLINDASLRHNPSFKSQYPVTVTLAPGLEERFEFSHAYGNGSPKRLYQRVPLSKQRTPRRKSVHDTAWMFEKVTKDIISRDSAVALVHVNAEQRTDSEIQRALAVLGSVCRVLNVSDEQAAIREFRELPELSLH